MDTTNTQQAPVAGTPMPKTSSGLDQNVAALLCYLLGFVGGLIFYLIEKENRFVKFHALQSIALSVVFFVGYIVVIILGFIPFIGGVLYCLYFLGGLGVFILCMVKAYQGEMYKLPILGDFVEKNLLK